MEAKQVYDGVLDIGRGHRDRLVSDVLMPLPVAEHLDAKGILLVALCESDDWPRHECHVGGGRVDDGNDHQCRRT